MLSIQEASAESLACSSITSSSMPTVHGRRVSGARPMPPCRQRKSLQRSHHVRPPAAPSAAISRSLGGAHQTLEKGKLDRVVVDQRLRVPLHPQQQRLLASLDRLDHTVIRPCNSAEVATELVDALMVEGVDLDRTGAHDLGEEAAWRDADRVPGLLAGLAVAVYD